MIDCRCVRPSTEIFGRRVRRGGGESVVTSSDCDRDSDDVRDFVRRGGGGRLIRIGGDGGCGAIENISSSDVAALRIDGWSLLDRLRPPPKLDTGDSPNSCSKSDMAVDADMMDPVRGRWYAASTLASTCSISAGDMICCGVYSCAVDTGLRGGASVSIQQEAEAMISCSGAVFTDRASSVIESVDCDGRRLLDAENNRFRVDNAGSDERCSDSGNCSGTGGTGSRCCVKERCLRGPF
jgi:hypothetical protein